MVVLGERAACLEIVTHGRPNQAGVIRDDSFCISWEYQNSDPDFNVLFVILQKSSEIICLL